MAMQQQFAVTATYLTATVTGSFDLETAKALAQAMLEAGAAEGRHLFLVDVRQLEGRLSASERYAYAEHLANEISARVAAGRLKRPRLVYVGHPPLMDRLHFGVTVAVNRGIDVIVTGDLAKAIHWLEAPPSPK